MRRFRAKVCVIGDPGVGKTSLVRRYVLGTFDAARTPTTGTEISTRGQIVDLRDIGLSVSKPAGGARVDWPPTFHLDMIIWDIVGNHGVPEDVKRAYFASARGFLAVADATRPETFRHLHRWTQWAAQAVGDVPLVVVLNKIDLDGKRTVPADAAEAFAESHGASLLHTSAKTDENVERAFRNLAADVVLHLLGF